MTEIVYIDIQKKEVVETSSIQQPSLHSFHPENKVFTYLSNFFQGACFGELYYHELMPNNKMKELYSLPFCGPGMRVIAVENSNLLLLQSFQRPKFYVADKALTKYETNRAKMSNTLVMCGSRNVKICFASLT